ncbi:ABC transporter, ATP-binding protein (cluster 5, nickel/peptides/opines) / ABC transporter, ATP-binding protein (cluster 5, nickel/peptides/opines) [hydrothermal vent metagenome]|uniref:ABC transporter, ATP-binding protein (Cluster 5, nickel/peptides/opines) / ABC transporter, ATP-binding protein (Cluster 5, nickel/peptides/opines) n=1 Tax=hydrothermal vent metagenome TaxID=652676 RepID=A0A3B0X4J3_9ZZZZ
MDNNILISIKDLSVEFKIADVRIQAVKHISFDIPEGSNIALVGESGSGKSVTALSILNLHESSHVNYPSGRISYQQKNLLTCSERELRSIRGRDIAMIFQEPMTSLNPVYPVSRQMTEVIMLHQKLSREKALKLSIELLDRVGIADPQRHIHSFPHMMSGGQRQRVMIAMALSCKPKLLIADEPTTALDVTIQKQILELLKNLQVEFNMSVLLITHDLNLVEHYSDYVCVMNQGEIVEQNQTEEIFKNPQHSYTQQLLASQPVQHLDQKVTDLQPLLQGKDIRVYFPVTKGFFKRKIGEVKAVDQVDIHLSKGETLGIVGESGSGKTTLGMALLRLQNSAGEICFNGKRLDNLTEASIRPMRKFFQVVFQDPFSSLSPRMTVEQIIGEGLQIHFPEFSAERRLQKIKQILREVDLDESSLWRYPHEFSGGQRQRIAIARVVILEPELILLDEPTSALDVSVQKQVLELLASLQKKHDLSYLFISHDLNVIRSISHRVMVMRQGKVVEEGAAEQIFTQPRQQYTRELLSAAMVSSPVPAS